MIPDFSFDTTPALRFEAGGAGRLNELAGPRLGPRILFVTDVGIIGLGLAGAPLESLSSGAQITVFDAVEPDPALATLQAAVEAGQGVTGVVGFGGGSVMDVAKLAALLLGSGEDIAGAWGVDRALGPRLPLVLVPTTAGTGSEVTPIAIITVGDTEKRGVSSRLLLPDLALLDADLTLGLPPPITAATGIDAMVHAIEAYASRSPNANPLSRLRALEALDLIGANIETAVTRGQDRSARAAMLMGAMLAGQAFANSPVAAVHALAYPIGARYHVAHGLSNALVLPHVLGFNADAAADEYAVLAARAFPGPAVGLAEAMAALSARLGLPLRLREVGVPEGDLDACAADAMLQTRLLVNNPRPLEERDARAIYGAAW